MLEKLSENTVKMNKIKKYTLKKYVIYSLLYGYAENNKQVQFNLRNNYKEYFYLKEVPHLTNKNPAIENNLLNLIANRDDLKK